MGVGHGLWRGTSLVWFILEILVISQYCIPYLYQTKVLTVKRQNHFKEMRMLQVPVGAQPCCCPSGPCSQHPSCLSQTSPPHCSLTLLTPPISFNTTLINNVALKKNSHYFPLSASNAGAVFPKKPAGPCSTMLPTWCDTTRFLFILHEEKHLSVGFEASFCI